MCLWLAGRAETCVVKGTWRRLIWWMVREILTPSLTLAVVWLCFKHVFLFVTGIKESVCWTPPPEVNPNKTCEYQALCSRFKELLTLPGTTELNLTHIIIIILCVHRFNVDLLVAVFLIVYWLNLLLSSSPTLSSFSDGYFNEDAKYNLCYCESCHKLRGDEAYYKRGEPPRDYALPFGWCRFALQSVIINTSSEKVHII